MIRRWSSGSTWDSGQSMHSSINGIARPPSSRVLE
jgi:hypothetical protein